MHTIDCDFLAKISLNTLDKRILLFILEKSPPLFMRVYGASHRLNSRQNDQHAKKGKNGGFGTGTNFGGEHWPGVGRDQRPVLVASHVSAWLARVRGLRHETGPGRYRKPRAACRPVEGRVIDDASVTRRRTPGHQRMAQRTRPDEADRQGVLCQ